MLILPFLLLDVMSLLALGYYIGIFWAIISAAASCIIGIYLCMLARRRFRARRQAIERDCIGGLPEELRLLETYEARVFAMLTLMFVFPGIFSDLFALLMLLPKFGKGYYSERLQILRGEAERQGKTLAQLLSFKCARRKD